MQININILIYSKLPINGGGIIQNERNKYDDFINVYQSLSVHFFSSLVFVHNVSKSIYLNRKFSKVCQIEFVLTNSGFAGRHFQSIGPNSIVLNLVFWIF